MRVVHFYKLYFHIQVQTASRLTSEECTQEFNRLGGTNALSLPGQSARGGPKNQRGESSEGRQTTDRAASSSTERVAQDDSILLTYSFTRDSQPGSSIQTTIVITQGLNNFVNDTHHQPIDVKTRCSEFALSHHGRGWFVQTVRVEPDTRGFAQYMRELWDRLDGHIANIEPHLLYASPPYPVFQQNRALHYYKHRFQARNETVKFERLAEALNRNICHISVHSHTARRKALHDARYALGGRYEQDWNSRTPDFLELYYNEENAELIEVLANPQQAVSFKYPVIRYGFSNGRQQRLNARREMCPHIIFCTNAPNAESHLQFNADGQVYNAQAFNLNEYRQYIEDELWY